MPTPHQLSSQNKLLAAFPAEDIAALEPHLETIDLSSGRILYECGQTIRHAYFPLNCVVSAVTYPLQTAGLIRQSRGVIIVTDRAGLEEAACECYSTTRRIFERHLPSTYSSAVGRAA